MSDVAIVHCANDEVFWFAFGRICGSFGGVHYMVGWVGYCGWERLDFWVGYFVLIILKLFEIVL